MRFVAAGKLFKKETIKGGYSNGRSKQIAEGGGGGTGIVDLSAFGGGAPAAPSNVPVYMQVRLGLGILFKAIAGTAKNSERRTIKTSPRTNLAFLLHFYSQERPQSPPWHHTNPLARIHPDWEEAAVLARIMDKLGTKGGGRRRRDRRLGTIAREMQGKMSKESGPKPSLLFSAQ